MLSSGLVLSNGSLLYLDYTLYMNPCCHDVVCRTSVGQIGIYGETLCLRLWRVKAVNISASLWVQQMFLNLQSPMCKYCLLQYNANEFSLKMEPVKRTCFSPHYLVIHNTLSIPSPAALCEVIDSGKLNQSGEDKGVADGDEPVHGSGISNLGKRVPCTYTQCCHRENSSYTWKYKKTTAFHLVVIMRLLRKR